jgi:tRNA A-37 threonylcarbamoyl transferase component Bud32/tetratricopeptide (TPR) repeat protein
VSTEADPLIGTAIAGRYVVREKLGAGGMGSVYLATQEPLGREVAVKVMLKELIADEVAVQRFHAEAQAVSRLNHPNIVTVFDFGATDDGTLFLVMEKLEGETLVSRLRRGPLPFTEAAPVIAQVARALHAAHAKGIVHRDLKPENVMITRTDGNEVVIKVLDFGLAKMVGGERRTGLTASDVIMGTPGYMSPEQIHGFPIDARSDIYALGVISWEMLTGRQLFSATSPVKILMRHLEEIPPSPSSVMPNAGIPPAAEALIARMLEKAPESRPATGEQVAVGIANPSSESWAVAPLGAGLPSQTPMPAAAPVVAAGAGGWDDAFSVLGEASFRAPTPVVQTKPLADGRAALPTTTPQKQVAGSGHGQVPGHEAVAAVSPSPVASRDEHHPAAQSSTTTGPDPLMATPSLPPRGPGAPQAPHVVATQPVGAPAASSAAPMNFFDIGMPQTPPGAVSTPMPASPPFPSPTPPTPRTSAIVDGPAEIVRPPLAAPSPAPRQRPSEPLWTITRGDRSESGIPESTLRRLAKDGHLKPMDLVAPSGEEPRPAHTFAVLGLRPPATPVVDVQQRRAVAVGARRTSRPLGAVLVVVIIVGALAALVLLRPTWLDELKALALGAADGVVPDLTSDDTPPVAPPNNESDPWKPVVDTLPASTKPFSSDDDVRAELQKALAALDDETDAGAEQAERAAAAILTHASDHPRARAIFLEARARRRGAARLLADIDAASLAARANLGEPENKRALVAVLVALDDPRALGEARALVAMAPSDAAAQVLHAEAALRVSVDEAVSAARAALAKAPRSSRASGMHGAALARAGLLDEAAPLLDARLREEPHDGIALLARALVEFRRGEHESAVKRLERGVAASPSDDRLRLAAVRLALLTKRAPARVRSLFAGAPPRTSTDAHWRRFVVERAAHVDDALPTADVVGDATLALLTVERALAAKTAPATSRLLDPVIASGDRALARQARALSAEAALAAGRFDDAAATFALAADEGDVLLGHAGKIVALLEKGDAEAAGSAVTGLLAVDLLAGLAFDPVFDTTFFSEAPVRLAEHIPANETSTFAADVARALLRLDVHDLAGTRAALDAAKKKDESHPVVLALFAVLELAREKPVLALFHLGKLRTAHTADAALLLPAVLRTEAQAAVGNVAAAKKAFIEIPSGTEAKGVRARAEGALLAAEGQTEQARALFETALKNAPFDGRARTLLARLHAR